MNPPARRAFTLVELLVVVGIIAVLVAILLPALQRARDQAQLVACLSNIRQVGMVAIGMYANDHNGKVTPLVGIRSGFTGLGGYGIAKYSLGWQVRSDNYPPGNPYNAMFADLIQAYLDPSNTRDNPKFTREYSPVFYCAADWVGLDGTNWGGGRPGWWANNLFREFSWRMNYSVTPIESFDYTIGMGIPKFGRKVSVPNASEKVLLAESHYESVAGAAGGSVNADGVNGGGILRPTGAIRNTGFSPPRHRSGFVVCFFDGSARVISFAARDKFCDDYPNGNWAVAGWGPQWDLDRP